jgi:hypothetical protein
VASLDEKESSRLLLILAITAGGMFMLAGRIYFMRITDPTMSDTVLHQNDIIGIPPFPGGILTYALSSGVLVLSSLALSAWLIISVRKTVMKLQWLIAILGMLVPLAALYLGSYPYQPVARELMLFVPPMTMVYWASILVSPQGRYRRWLLYFEASVIVPMFVGGNIEFWPKPQAAATMYILTLASGLVALALIILAREEHLRYLHSTKEAPSSRTAVLSGPRPAAATTAENGPTSLSATPPRRSAFRRPRPAVVIAAAGVVLAMVFLPPVWVLDSPSSLGIYWQEATRPEGSQTKASTHLQAIVVNNGSRAAEGLIELRVSYKNATYPAGSITFIDSFGSWLLDTHITLQNWSSSGPQPTITLLFNSAELETQVLHIPAANPLFALAAFLLLKGVLDRRRGREPDG